MDDSSENSVVYWRVRSATSVLLFLIFLVLKLVGVIDWHWVWVCAPLWFPFLIDVAALIVAVLIFIVLVIIEAIKGD